MTSNEQLKLYEQLMLLALRDDTGVVAAGMYQYAIGGAIIAELLMDGRIQIEPGKRKLVNVIDAAPTGDGLLDECLQRMATARRRASISTWVSRFASVKQLKHRVAGGLVARGILRSDEDKVLFVFPRRIYPEADHTPEARLIERLRRVIFTDTEQVDPRTVVLVSLARSAGLLNIPFDKKQLKQRKARLDKIVNGELAGKATKDAIDAMQAAVMVACIMPAVMTATITASH